MVARGFFAFRCRLAEFRSRALVVAHVAYGAFACRPAKVMVRALVVACAVWCLLGVSLASLGQGCLWSSARFEGVQV